MKKLIKISLTLFFLAFIISSCQKDNVAEEVTQTVDEATANKMAEEETKLLVEPILSDVSESKEMEIINDGFPADIENDQLHHRIGPVGNIIDLKDCLDSLSLSQVQHDSIHHALVRRNACRMHHLQQVRQINIQILMNGNQQRMQLIHQYQNGQITQQQLHQQLHQLRMQVMYQMRNNPQKIQHLQAIRECSVRFFLRLQQILTPQQWQQFKTCYQ